ncbi:MAG: hypothetical protein JOZ43_00965, partial [Acidobacteriales bacterium]|nr:hypothetical protein [Terriglobales bacterium]
SAPQVTSSAPQSAHGALGIAVAATRAIFYVVGITQPTARQERSVTAGFWATVAALIGLLFWAVMSILAHVATVKA